jgi:hypothetical protein
MSTFIVEKGGSKIWLDSVIFTTLSKVGKHYPDRQKFAQSGHPDLATRLFFLDAFHQATQMLSFSVSSFKFLRQGQYLRRKFRQISVHRFDPSRFCLLNMYAHAAGPQRLMMTLGHKLANIS